MEACIQEHWCNPEGNYDWVIGQIAYADTAQDKRSGSNLHQERKEARQRSHALNQIKRAARSLLGLRRIPPQQSPDT
jgi:hypothetical protein